MLARPLDPLPSTGSRVQSTIVGVVDDSRFCHVWRNIGKAERTLYGEFRCPTIAPADKADKADLDAL